MITAVDYILEGLARTLEVERECGVRTFELDRSLLIIADADRPADRSAEAVATSVAAVPPPVERAAVPPAPAEVPAARIAPPPVKPAPSAPVAPSLGGGTYDFVFLHHAPLSEEGVAMMAKIIPAMGKTPETAPVVVAGERPQATCYVVMGKLAVDRWFPGLQASAGIKAAPGMWCTASGGEKVLVTYSPEYVLKYDGVLMAPKVLKSRMWTSLKSVLQRLK